MDKATIILVILLLVLIITSYIAWHFIMKREMRKQIFYAISIRTFLPEGELIQKLQFHYGLSEDEALKWIKKYKESVSKGYPTYE